MSQKLPVYGFTWVEEASQFNEEFIKIDDKESDIGNLLKLMIYTLKNCL